MIFVWILESVSNNDVTSNYATNATVILKWFKGGQ